MLPTFPESWEIYKKTWTSDLCLGERFSGAALQATSIVKGNDDDDDAICKGKRERQEKMGDKRRKVGEKRRANL